MEPLAEGEKGVRSAHTQSKVKALGDDLPGEHNGGHGAGTQGVGKVGSGGWLGDEFDGLFWLS